MRRVRMGYDECKVLDIKCAHIFTKYNIYFYQFSAAKIQFRFHYILNFAYLFQTMF